MIHGTRHLRQQVHKRFNKALQIDITYEEVIDIVNRALDYDKLRIGEEYWVCVGKLTDHVAAKVNDTKDGAINGNVLQAVVKFSAQGFVWNIRTLQLRREQQRLVCDDYVDNPKLYRTFSACVNNRRRR